MRLLCIPVGISLLIWQIETAPPLILVGFYIATTVVCVRLTSPLGLFPGAVMVGVGILLSFMPFTTSDTHQMIEPFADIALSWTGLLIGTGLTRPVLQNRRLVAGAVYLFATPFLAVFCVLLFFELPLTLHLQLALIGGLAAPVFFSSQNQKQSDSRALALLVTAMGLCLFGLISLPSYITTIQSSLPQVAQMLVIAVIGIELAHRWLLHVRSRTGQHTSWSALALLVTIAAWHLTINPLILSWPVGLAISLRSNTGLRPGSRVSEVETLVGFALAYYASYLFSNAVSYFSTPTYFVVVLGAMISGKVAGGILATRFTSQPVQVWLPLLPQGLLAVVCFARIVPGDAPAAYLLCGCIVLPVVYRISDIIAHKIKNGRRKARRSAIDKPFDQGEKALPDNP